MNQFQVEVCKTLWSLQIPAHLRGYEYIKSAMDIIHADNTAIHHVIKLYEQVAEKHGTTHTRVERGIRHVIGKIRADKDTRIEVLGAAEGLPNAEFLATLNEAINLRMAGAA